MSPEEDTHHFKGAAQIRQKPSNGRKTIREKGTLANTVTGKSCRRKGRPTSPSRLQISTFAVRLATVFIARKDWRRLIR